MIKFILYITMCISFLSCSNPFGSESTVDNGHNPGADNTSTVKVYDAVNAKDLVSSSGQYAVSTTRSYLVSHSVGELTKDIEVVTTNRGYKVYSNVQGVLNSQK